MTPLQRLDLASFQIAVASQNQSALHLALLAHEILSEKIIGIQKSLKRLDFLFHEFKATTGEFKDPLEGISALNTYLFTDKKFEGLIGPITGVDQVFLIKVIENRGGCPLSLSLIYRELARRVQDIPVDLVNFPGHQLIKILYNHQLLFLDPADGGKLLSVSELQTKLTRRFGKSIVLNSAFLETPLESQVAVRFLTRLKNIYFELRDWTRLLAVLDMILICDPGRLMEYKERGLLLYQLGQRSAAYDDIRNFVARSRPSPEIEKLKTLITHLQNPDVTPLY